MQTPSFPPSWLPFAAAIVMAAAVPARADIYSVGTEGCSHATIQQAVDAAEANPGEDFIRIPHNQVWNGQAIVINTAQTLWFEGYWSDCNTIDDSTHTTLDGGGGSAAPVIRIEAAAGSVIGFDFLDIRNGDVSGNGGKGGGIWYRGNGTLSIKNGSIYNNTAGRGGGLYLEGTGDAATVHVLANVGITGNVARDSGGGVFAEAVHFYMLEPNSIIAFNEAVGIEVLGVPVGGYGGGLVVNPKSGLNGDADIGGSGVGGAGLIYANSARHGGGIAVLGEPDISNHVELRAYTIDPARPVAIRDNFASVSGGGLFVKPYTSLPSDSSWAYVHLWNAVVDLNHAPDGAAIYLDSSTTLENNTLGGILDWNYSRPALAAPCPDAGPCGRIAGNVAMDANGTPTDGAIVNLREASDVFIGTGSAPRGIIIEGNRGGRLFDLEGGEDRVFLTLSNSLVVDNVLDLELLRARDEPFVSLSDTTIAGNVIGAAHVLAVSDELVMKRSILWQPGATSFTGNGTPDVESTITSDAASLGGGPGAITVASPRFIDPENGDYRLRAASPAIDYAPPVEGDDRDVFGLPRDQDIPVVPGVVSYVRDIGAHERASLQPVVLNGDFVLDLNLWPGQPTAWSSENAAGPAGSAQVALDGVGPGATVVGASQCIHLPGPGTWLLNGWGRAAGASSASGTDYVELLWEYRRDGGESCTDGFADGVGVHVIGSIGDNWTRPQQPAQVLVTAGDWNHNSSVTVRLAVRDSEGTATNVNGWFDGITLEWSAAGSDVIFADGFDGQ